MTSLEKYRLWYEQEKDCNRRMLKMIDSVPETQRADPRFTQALELAAHLAACRENWLDRMTGVNEGRGVWWPKGMDLTQIREWFTVVEARWTCYLAELTEDALDVDFEFKVSANKGYRWNIEGQIVQLVGHAFYHRGQIGLLVDQLGGKTVDTDYLFWAFKQEPDRWKEL
jgi:uncharacterized damage-inducible protein DinB